MKSSLIKMTIVAGVFIAVYANCSKSSSQPQPPDDTPDTVIVPQKISLWQTKADQSALLQQLSISFTSAPGSATDIVVDTTKLFQTIDGFGFTLTGGSAQVINKLPASDKAALLRELFGHTENAIGISYLRISVGASDLSAEVFSYDDIPDGTTDLSLEYFSLSKDTVDIIPLLKEIIAINPAIKIMGTPWSPPVWMKSNKNSIGGSLLPEYYDVYARYLVKYIQAMKAEGITIDAITPQNEPLHGGNNPSMVMTAVEQATFIKNNLGPAFRDAGITTKIIIYDHNCDKPEYPITILDDAAARAFVDGSAFHLYAGDVSALSTVYNAHPDKKLYFTEQWTGSKGTFNGDLQWHIKNVIIGTMRNRSSIALEWNLANDPTFGPHTPGGCTECKGALTIGSGITRNVAYYIIAHASKFVPPGSVRISSTQSGALYSVAFKTPAGKKVLIVLNDGNTTLNFTIKYHQKSAPTSLAGGTVATYVW